jgi:hypothetical protein
MHDIRYNAKRDEIVVPISYANAVITFRGGANGQEAPIRVIQGPNSQVSGDRLALDEVHDELFIGSSMAVDPINNLLVTTSRTVRVYPIDANGDVPPKRVLSWNPGPGVDTSESLLIFDRTASGNTPPLRVIRGAQTQIDRINQIRVWPEGRLIFAAMPGLQGYMEPPRTFLGVWSLDDNGNMPPKWAISGEQTTLYKVFGVAINPEQKEIYLSDMRQHGVLTYHVPEVFEPAAAPPVSAGPAGGGRSGGGQN